MGIVRMGPPTDLVLALRDRCGISLFVETGTFHGQTAAWAADHFARVVTVERAEALHRAATAAHAGRSNVEFVLGDSRTVLASLLPTLDSPALFWLDGHWSGGETSGRLDQCPLLDELDAICSSELEHVVFVDDARLFESTPPRPLDPAQWPPIDQVVSALPHRSPTGRVAIVEDVIVSVPPSGVDSLVAYCQDVNTRAWEAEEEPSPRTSLGTRIRRRLAGGIPS